MNSHLIRFYAIFIAGARAFRSETFPIHTALAIYPSALTNWAQTLDLGDIKSLFLLRLELLLEAFHGLHAWCASREAPEQAQRQDSQLMFQTQLSVPGDTNETQCASEKPHVRGDSPTPRPMDHMLEPILVACVHHSSALFFKLTTNRRI